MTAARESTTLEYALLGILSLGKKSAYDVRQLFVETPMTQFSSSPGSIYPALKRLENQNLVRSRLEAGKRGSDRRTYKLSNAGRRRLDTWLRKAPTKQEMETQIQTIFLRFSFMDGRLEKDAVLEFLGRLRPLLEGYRGLLEQFVARFREMGALHAELGAQHGVMTFSSYIEWVDEARQRISIET